MSAARNPGPKTPQRFGPAAAHGLRLFYFAAAGILLVSTLAFFVLTWRWPLVGDASVIHYVAFLIGRGWVPYRQLSDQQFPGAYLIEIAGMHIFGRGSLAWRMYDFTLLGIAAAAFFVVTRESGENASAVNNPVTLASGKWFPGLFAACLFALIHGRDGLEQGGQRDFAMAVLLLTATAFLFTGVRRRWIWASAAFGLLSGVAWSIKPTVLPLSVAELSLACYICARDRVPWRPHAIAAALASLAGPAAGVAFLAREHAFTAFLAGFGGIVPYYTSLAHRPLSYILQHSISPILPLVLLWLLVVTIRISAHSHTDWIRDWQRTCLLAGAVFALVDCILQARALPYYRYPLLAFLLPLMALDFHRAARELPRARSRVAPWLGLAAIFFGAFILAPQSAVLIHRYRWWETDFISSLERDLTRLGGPALSRHIECVDSISGCTTVLYRMRLEPAIGLPGDYVLFGRYDAPIVRETRARMDIALAQNAPTVIVVSSPTFLDTSGPAGTAPFQKLSRWPEFAELLATRYSLATEWHPTRTNRWWSRAELPAAYRIYVIRPADKSQQH